MFFKNEKFSAIVDKLNAIVEILNVIVEKLFLTYLNIF
jgi:hypothetical protein